jgi:hypothetical protein
MIFTSFGRFMEWNLDEGITRLIDCIRILVSTSKDVEGRVVAFITQQE